MGTEAAAKKGNGKATAKNGKAEAKGQEKASPKPGESEGIKSQYQPSNTTQFPGQYKGQYQQASKPHRAPTPAEQKYHAGKRTAPSNVVKLSDRRKASSVKTREPRLEDIVTEQSFDQLQAEYKAAKDQAPKTTFGQKVKGFIKNMYNIPVNGLYNTIFYPIAMFQNAKTRKEIRNNPDGKEPVVYLQAGVMQNMGAQARAASYWRKKGFLPYHIKGYHHLPAKEKREKHFEQIHGLYHDRNSLRGKGSKQMQVAPYREAVWDGHSSGADSGIYLAQDSRVEKYKVRRIIARAPVPTGLGDRPLNIAQKAIMMIASGDDTRTLKGKKAALTMHERPPKVPVDVYSGKYDMLAVPYSNIYKYASSTNLIDHPSSSHFGTSGVNRTMNATIIDHAVSKMYGSQESYHNDPRRKEINERKRKIA